MKQRPVPPGDSGHGLAQAGVGAERAGGVLAAAGLHDQAEATAQSIADPFWQPQPQPRALCKARSALRMSISARSVTTSGTTSGETIAGGTSSVLTGLLRS